MVHILCLSKSKWQHVSHCHAEEHCTHYYSLLGSRFLHCGRNFLSKSSIYCLSCGDQRVDGASSGGVCPIKEVRTFSVIWLPTPPLLEGGGILFLIATLLRKRVLKQHLFPFIVSIANYFTCACFILHLLTYLQSCTFSLDIGE